MFCCKNCQRIKGTVFIRFHFYERDVNLNHVIGFRSPDDSSTERVVWVILRVPWAGYSPIGHVLYSGITTSVCKEKIFLVSREMKWRISISQCYIQFDKTRWNELGGKSKYSVYINCVYRDVLIQFLFGPNIIEKGEKKI